MKILAVLPILVPLTTAIVALFAWRHRRIQRVLTFAGMTVTLSAAIGLLISVWQNGILAVHVGNWRSPFGITLAADLLSAIMVVMAGIMGLATTLYSLATVDTRRESFGYYPLLNVLLMGVCGAFLTGDMFNLYVWFEVMLISSFVLLALGGERAQLEGAIKYVTLNLLSSALFLAAVGMLYGVAGTLNMADLALQFRTSTNVGLITALAMLFLIAFGIKAAIFPLYFWLPASYHTPPVAVSAIFAGLLTKVGVYALIRVFTLLFVGEVSYTHTLLLIISGLTMVFGVVGAVAQLDFRRLLSFHIISQIGYMVMGLGLYTPLALSGAVFYIIHHIIVKTNLFLISGIVNKLKGSFHLKKLGGLYHERPLIAFLFLIPALSLAGVPPLSGFWAKYALVKAGLEVESYVIVAAALIVSVLTLVSMTKLWAEVFWKNQPDGTEAAAAPLKGHARLLLMLPVVCLATMTLAIGWWGEPIFVLASRTADQLLNPTEYIQTVLGG